MLDTHDPGQDWTDNSINRLKKLHAEGHSYSAIGRMLGGVTRSTISGKINRLGMAGMRQSGGTGWPARSREDKERRKQRRMMRAVEQKTRRLEKRILPERRRIFADFGTPGTLPAPHAADVARIAHDNLEPHHCRYPCGENPGQDQPYFCGDRKVEGLAYCAEHARRCLVPPSARPNAHMMRPSWQVRHNTYKRVEYT